MVRAGIIPLRIHESGVQTYQTKVLEFGEGWRPIMPEWVQRKERAYFAFVILFPTGAGERGDCSTKRERSRAGGFHGTPGEA